MAPALHASRGDLAGALKEGGVRSRRPRPAPRFSARGLLVPIQVALALVLLVGAGLLDEEPREPLRVFRRLPAGRRPDAAIRPLGCFRRRSRPKPSPSVARFSSASPPCRACRAPPPDAPRRCPRETWSPSSARSTKSTSRPSGRFTGDQGAVQIGLHDVSPDYFKTLSIPIRKGRPSRPRTARARPRSPSSANPRRASSGPARTRSAAASRRPPSSSRTTRRPRSSASPATCSTASPASRRSWISTSRRFRRAPLGDALRQDAGRSGGHRPRGPPRDQGPRPEPAGLRRRHDGRSDRHGPSPASASARPSLGLLAVIALFLASVGIYGLVAETVARRPRRSACGWRSAPRPATSSARVLERGLLLAGVGLAAGLVAALALSQLLSSLSSASARPIPGPTPAFRSCCSWFGRGLLDPGAPRHARRPVTALRNE